MRDEIGEIVLLGFHARLAPMIRVPFGMFGLRISF